MWIFFLAFFVVVIIFVLAFKSAMRYIGKRFGETVRRRHEAAEHIVETGLPPAEWQQAAREQGSDSDKSDAARRRMTKHVDGLLRYFQTAPVFDSEDTRRELLGELESARDNWVDMKWEVLVGEEQPDRGPSEPEGDDNQ